MGIVTYTMKIFREKSPGFGEDACLSRTDGEAAALIACLDGCGGSGSRRYPLLGNWTGARCASHGAGDEIYCWFDREQYALQGTEGKSLEKLAAEIYDTVSKRMDDLMHYAPSQGETAFSRMARSFPTTLAAMLVEALAARQCRICSFWAGDSRTFFFPFTGLIQTSRDDIRGGADPFASLMNDGILNNVLQANAAFEIHASEIIAQDPCMILTATDGCFSYFPSPMYFEWVLLECLVEAKNPAEWEALLDQRFLEVAGDDYSLQLAVVGFDNFQAIQTAYAPRWRKFQVQYAEPLKTILEENDLDRHRALWEQYKTAYFRGEG